MAIGVGISGPRSSGGGGGATGGYVRPSEWLAMTTLSNGDDKIVLLVAVWENASNFLSLKCSTSSGTYTIAWGDGNTSSGITSAAQSDHVLDYSGLSADTSAYGYRQAIVTITADSGNLTVFNLNVRHGSGTNDYSTGVLECNIASQSITDLGDMFRSQNEQKHPWIERFEYFGTCNVTDWAYAFYDSGIQYFKATSPNTTDARYLFYSSSIRYLHGKLGSGSCNAQYMFQHSTNINEMPSTWDLTGFSNVGYMIGFSSLGTFGTVDNPIALPDNADALQFARATATLREVNIASGYFKGNMQLLFYQSKMLTAVRGLNGTAITGLSNAFTQTYSLQTLESSNIAVSFDLSDCNFATQGLVDIFNDLASATATITITGNPGTAGLSAANIAIATDKGWTVTT